MTSFIVANNFKGDTMNVLVETERLIITEMTMDMAMDIHKNSLDEDTRRFVPDEVFETLEDAKETVEFLMSQYGSTDGPLVYAVILKADNTNIGYVQLVPIGEGKWEIGYHVAKAYTCKGYATEAIDLLCDYVFKNFFRLWQKELGLKKYMAFDSWKMFPQDVFWKSVDLKPSLKEKENITMEYMK